MPCVHGDEIKVSGWWVSLQKFPSILQVDTVKLSIPTLVGQQESATHQYISLHVHIDLWLCQLLTAVVLKEVVSMVRYQTELLEQSLLLTLFWRLFNFFPEFNWLIYAFLSLNADIMKIGGPSTSQVWSSVGLVLPFVHTIWESKMLIAQFLMPIVHGYFLIFMYLIPFGFIYHARTFILHQIRSLAWPFE